MLKYATDCFIIKNFKGINLMVVIRLALGGNRDRKFYFIVAADSRARRDGRFIEKLGFYNPIGGEKVESFRIDIERFNHWVNVGAQASPTVKKLMKQNTKKTEVA